MYPLHHPFFKASLPWIVILLLVVVVVFLNRSQKLMFFPEPLSETADVLKNPYQGFYRIVPYTLTDDGSQQVSTVSEYDLPLVLLEINLEQFRDGPISDPALGQLDAILDTWSQSDSQILLRFLYDWNGIARTKEPNSLSTILTHIDQVGEIVNRYPSSVYLMQGVLIGNWGEMHGSAFSDDGSVQTLVNHLHRVIDPSIYLSLRTPAQWRMVTGLNDLPEASFSDGTSLAARLGLYNDGMLGSLSDLGTYGDTLRKDAGPGTREEEIRFQNQLCQYVPNGGEVVYNTPYNDLPAAVQYLQAIHVSYLNADYDPAALDKWKSTVWKEADVFSGCDGLTYVKAHLGYRYTARKFTLQKRGLFQPHIHLCLTLDNVGFSNTLKPFEAAFLLENTDQGEHIRLPVAFDFRTLTSGKNAVLTASIPASDLPEGSYRILFSLTDGATGREILLANTSYMEGAGLLLGQLDY